MHRISTRQQKAFSSWYLIVLVLALAAVIAYMLWHLIHPHPVHTGGSPVDLISI